MEETDKIILEYWNTNSDKFPKVFTMGKMFNKKPEEICDLLFNSFEKAEFYNRTIYFKKKCHKTFEFNPISFVLEYKYKKTNYLEDISPNKFCYEIEGFSEEIEKNTHRNGYKYDEDLPF